MFPTENSHIHHLTTINLAKQSKPNLSLYVEKYLGVNFPVSENYLSNLAGKLSSYGRYIGIGTVYDYFVCAGDGKAWCRFQPQLSSIACQGSQQFLNDL